ncbi:MAG: glycosyltransferase [Bacillota bacterium]
MKKKIAFFIPNLGGGGAERVVSNLTLNLDSQKYDKYLIVYDDNKIVYPYDAKLISLASERRSNFIANFFSHFERIKKLKEVKKKYKFDVVFSFLPQPNTQNILTKGDEKVIVSVRNFISKRYHFFNKLKAKWLYKKADVVVSVSKELKQELISGFNVSQENIKVIYNPYDLEKIRDKAQEEIGEEYQEIFNKKVIITMGSLHRQKGQWHLLRSFSKLLEKNYDLNLVLLGQGELEEELKKLAKKLNMADNVYFLGFQNNPFKFLKRSYLYVFPSLYEGFPNALAEAMACELPVISTDCQSGPREILAPNISLDKGVNYEKPSKHGILVEDFGVSDDLEVDIKRKELSKKEKSLAEKIENILTDQNKHNHFSKQSKKRVKDFSMKKIIKDWENLI